MKIEILNENNIYEFILPTKVEGNFWIFDDINEDVKLLNVEASNGEWVLRCADDVNFVSDKVLVKNATLKPDSVYTIEYNGKNRVVIVSRLKDDGIKNYNVPMPCEIVIGKEKQADVRFDNDLVLSKQCKLTFKENVWSITLFQGACVYANGSRLIHENQILENGSVIYVFGLKLLLLGKLVRVNNFGGLVYLNLQKFSMVNLQNTVINPKVLNDPVNEKKIYSDDDYFFKAPRLRRFIETFELKIDPPPNKSEEQEMPVLYVIGPMLASGMTSMVSFANALLKISTGEATFKEQWTSIVIGGAMLTTTLVWPNLTKKWQKKQKIKKEKMRQKKYSKYLNEKRKAISDEYARQKQILIENLTTLNKCREIIQNREIQLWERKVDQKDFLTVRTGIGDLPLDISINYEESDFVFEEDNLKSELDKLLEENKILTEVPVGYSFLNNRITAIMGILSKRKMFVDNILLQILTFHSYDDLKIVVLTNKRNSTNYEYLKYAPHLFSNDKEIRFFGDNEEDIKEICNYLDKVYITRKASLNGDGGNKEIDLRTCSPYFLVITDIFDKVRKIDFVDHITNEEVNYGFSLMILEDRLSKLPSSCNDFINLDETESIILKNDSDVYNQQKFKNEMQEDFSMRYLCKRLANIPIEFADDLKMLPDSVTFLEMYDVGKVEQLNSLNRWRLNNPVKTLKAEIGVNEVGDKVYLDLHEKFHGPHGLVAGMTGSGKSEFIVTYVLSMAVNYSPNEVAFVLIDYKGGGLAGAFDNKGNGLRLPHLAGTITNLDKAEMNRSLASIDSELKKRQSMFNDARNKLGESTIDIYKYQQFFREGKLDEPIPHLIIVCDEFAELKTQQPEFMENLISTARIGRSLGVHLILATQKPSGVVDAQIWSNTKFRVCLKVQDKSDSNEMLKRPDAAELKQVGRFYLQVGYNEMFLLGQSGYAGAKYFPSDSTKKEVDKSLNVINNIGTIVTSASNDDGNKKAVFDGEQLAKVLGYICDLAKKNNLYSRKLWLDSIPSKIYVKNLFEKYAIKPVPFQIDAIVGEYDSPTQQTQNIFTLDLTNEGNTIIYGINGSDKEMALNSILYSVCATHSTEEVNFYLLDFGSEAMRAFAEVRQVGDMVFLGEDEKLANLFKLIDQEISKRKKLFVPYSGKYTSYIANSGEKLPLIVIMLNDYDAFLEAYANYDDILLQYSRDGLRYGIVFIITVNAINAIRRRMKQNFQNEICLQMNSLDDFVAVLGKVKGFTISEIPGRGLMKRDIVYEFQTSMICDEEEFSDKIKEFTNKEKELNYAIAKHIPVLPNVVTVDMLLENEFTLEKVPIGITKNSLDVHSYDFTSNPSTLITANETNDLYLFSCSLFQILRSKQEVNLITIDTEGIFKDNKDLFNFYYDTSFEEVIPKLGEFFKNQVDTSKRYFCILAGVDKLNTKVDAKILEEYIKICTKSENINFLIIDSARDIKKLDFESWFRPINVNTDGFWIGSGIIDQNTIKVPNLTKEMKIGLNSSFGWVMKNGTSVLVKLATNIEIGGEEEDEG